MSSPLFTYQDRREALKRSLLYRADFLKWAHLQEAIKSAPAKKLSTKTSGDLTKQLRVLEFGMKRRWKCKHPFPVSIEAGKEKAQSEEGHGHAWQDEKVRIVKLEPMKLSEPVSPLWAKGFLGYDPFVVMYDYKSSRIGKLKASSGTGKHLCLIVDLSVPLDVLTKEINRQVGRYRGFYHSLHPGRNKPNREVGNIWAIYDKVTRLNSVSKVASPFAKKKRSDSSVGNPEAAMDSAVRRAVSKAKRFIQQVEREARR